MTDHLDYEPKASGKSTGNSRNGRSRKTVKSGEGDVNIISEGRQFDLPPAEIKDPGLHKPKPDVALFVRKNCAL